ncbi:MAG: hypothetical protein R3C46_11725 [Hyphomonadaceae bacterium]
MTNSIRLLLAALIISGVTYAAAGAPASPTSAHADTAQPAPAMLALHTP